MAIALSVLMITKNSDELLDTSLSSIANLADEIVIVDDFSKDKTISIAKKYKSVTYSRHEDDLGSQRAFGLSKCRGEWILMLDADEVISQQLKGEIRSIVDSRLSNVSGYKIQYQNHLFGKPIYFGGENYRILRLFKRKKARINSNLVHEHVKINGLTDLLQNKILHYSYRRPCQIIQKFTDYAHREARKKAQQNEKLSLQKLILYPCHMVWALYIKDKGYKDGLIRLFLDLAFGYMEFCTYFFLIFERNRNKK